jgi:thymidylate synthase
MKMKSYLKLLSDVMTRGEERSDRTGVGTRGIFGYQWRHHLRDGFPLLTTKKVHFKSILVELLWFLRGDTNIRFLKENGVSIWDEWADENGDLGPVYGKQWRSWPDYRTGGTIDQLELLVNDLRSNPFSRRHIVNAWNPADVPFMKLPPCHTLWQCHVSTRRELNLHLYARSIDSFLGLPFNIASYALLDMVLARATGLEPGELVISFGDLHIYKNHFEQVKVQLDREPRSLPSVLLPNFIDLKHFRQSLDWATSSLQPNGFSLIGYDPHPAIKAPVAI